MLNKTRSSRKHTWKYLLIVPVLTIVAGLLSASKPAPVKVNGEKYIQTRTGMVDSLYKKRFPGGADGFAKFISRNIHYPRASQLAFETGAVTAEFQLARDGSVKNVKIIDAAQKDMGQEVERLLNMLPKFDAAPSGKTKTILFTIVFLMHDDNGKLIGPDLNKVKADNYVIGYSVLHKEE